MPEQINKTEETPKKRTLKAIVVDTPDGENEIEFIQLSDLTGDMRKQVYQKFQHTIDGSNTLLEETGTALDQAELKVIDPPYNPDQLALLLTLNAVHARCCMIKATDATAQGFLLAPSSSFNTGEDQFSEKELKELNTQRFMAKKILNSVEGGNGYSSLSKKLLLDYQSIGWMSAEVIRNEEGEILDVVHVPAKEVVITKDGYFLQMRDMKAVRFLPFGKKFNFDVLVPELDPDDDSIDYFDVVKSHRKRRVSGVKQISTDAKKPISKVSNFKDSATEMIFVAQPHPSTRSYGVPEIISALASLNANVSIEDYINQFFDHHAIPQFLITVTGVDDIDDDFIKVINKFLRENIKRKHHSTAVLPAPEGATIKIEKLSEVNQEGGFQETRKNNQQEILIAHGMTPAQVGIIDSANLGSGSGLSQAENYKNRILGPIQDMFEKLFWNKILGAEGQGLLAIEIDFKSLDIRDLEMLRQRHDTYLRHGVMSVNEVRQELNMEPTEGGERNFLLLANDVVFLDNLEEVLSRTDQEINSTLKSFIKKLQDEDVG